LTLNKVFVDGNTTCHTNSFIIAYVIDGTIIVNGETVNQGDTLIISTGENEINCSGIGRAIIIIPKEKEETRPKMRKVALITGIVTQDVSNLAEFLLNKGYEVHGLINSKSQLRTDKLDALVYDPNIYNIKLFFHIGDLTDTSSLNRLLEKVRPDEIYNLASQSHVDLSFELPEYTAQVNSLGTLRLLDASKQNDLSTRLFNESSSQIFDENVNSDGYQAETTPVSPENPYATSKAYAHFIVQNYRRNYGIYAVNGILFNHTYPREDEPFVCKKVTTFVGLYAMGNGGKLYVGNLESERDWGYTPDNVEGMWLSLQQMNPDDYIIANGKTQSVKELIELSFMEIGIRITWVGEGLNVKGIYEVTGDVIVEVDPTIYRFSDTSYLKGYPAKAM
jgi:GDPmannose 4,6-dehydratase